MKAAFIAYNQAHVEEVEAILHQLSIRGFTRWQDIQGRGTKAENPTWERTHGLPKTWQHSA